MRFGCLQNLEKTTRLNLNFIKKSQFLALQLVRITKPVRTGQDSCFSALKCPVQSKNHKNLSLRDCQIVFILKGGFRFAKLILCSGQNLEPLRFSTNLHRPSRINATNNQHTIKCVRNFLNNNEPFWNDKSSEFQNFLIFAQFGLFWPIFDRVYGI